MAHTNASIDLLRSVVEGEGLQSVEVDRSIINVAIKSPTMVVEGRVFKGDYFFLH
jgi:hypothetical protein